MSNSEFKLNKKTNRFVKIGSRTYHRGIKSGDISEDKAMRVLRDTGLTPKTADEIYYLTSLAKFDDRFNIPPAHREQAIEMLEFTGDVKGNTGFGSRAKPERGS